MTDSPASDEDAYELIVARPAKRALSEELPTAVAWAATDLITGDLSTNPRRVGKELNEPLEGIYSARVMTDWRILYEIDDESRTITIKDVRHRRHAYRQVPKG